MMLGDRIPAICAGHAAPCAVEVVQLTNAMSLDFPTPIRQLIHRGADRLKIPAMDIYSAAGHDARFLHRICPTGMIFVPCKGGISHNEAGQQRRRIWRPARVLAEVILELAT